jgi:hypothetical protein
MDAQQPTQFDVGKLVAAIYRAEGGPAARVPFGILSVPVSGFAEARQVCFNTVNDSLTKWNQAGRPGEFIPWLASTYCPVASDPTGNANWIHNVTAIYNQIENE